MRNIDERFSRDWREKQAELLEQFLDVETIDVKGIIEFLNEVHFDRQQDAEFILMSLMYHLADAEFYSKSISDDRYRMERKIECRHFIFDLHSIFFKDGTLRNADLYNKGGEIAAGAWKDALDLVDKIKKRHSGLLHGYAVTAGMPLDF